MSERHDPRYARPPSVVLKRAKEIFEKAGYGPSFGENKNGTMCVGYALARAGMELSREGFSGTWQEARNYVEIDDMSEWNDEPGRTVQQCLEMFDTAIALAEKHNDEPREDWVSP